MAKKHVAVLALCLLLVAAGFVPGGILSFESQAQINLPPEAAWHKLRDLSLAHHYVPGTERTEMTSAITEGVGASRRVYASETEYLIETVTEWQPGTGFTLELLDESGAAPLPFTAAQFSYEIESAQASGSSLRTRLAVQMRGGLLGEWIGGALIGASMQERVDAVSVGMKSYYEE